MAQLNTSGLRRQFLIEQVFEPGHVHWTYSHYDRVMIGGAQPVGESLHLAAHENLRSGYFLERREIGILNVGGHGTVTADGKVWELAPQSCLYLGKGVQNVQFDSRDASLPALFYLLSAPAHQAYPATLYTREDASPMTAGSAETSNLRTISKYIHADGIQSCQLVMGLTTLHTGSVWNTMPAHVHDRRMEAYFYFGVPAGQQVLHLMGPPQETRSLWIQNHQAVISPPWSIHSGCGTSGYSFIWGMAGENKDYTDMDPIAIADLR